MRIVEEAPVLKRPSQDEVIGTMDFVGVDAAKCSKCGQCCMKAGDTFTAVMSGSRISGVRTNKGGFKSQAEAAAYACPKKAITISW